MPEVKTITTAMNKLLETPGILKIVDTQILPLLTRYWKATGATKKTLAYQLLEHNEIFRYHYPEDYQECQSLVRRP